MNSAQGGLANQVGVEFTQSQLDMAPQLASIKLIPGPDGIAQG
jgi:hypothetical protein